MRKTVYEESREKKFFGSSKPKKVDKTLGNTDSSGATKNVKDIVFWGDGDTFKLISKASSEAEGWMKSTKAMDVGNGCVVQVTTQQGKNIAEALTFVPGVKIIEDIEDGEVISRHLEPIETWERTAKTEIENATAGLMDVFNNLKGK